MPMVDAKKTVRVTEILLYKFTGCGDTGRPLIAPLLASRHSSTADFVNNKSFVRDTVGSHERSRAQPSHFVDILLESQ